MYYIVTSEGTDLVFSNEVDAWNAWNAYDELREYQLTEQPRMAM